MYTPPHAILVHGLSRSPFSMYFLARKLHAAGVEPRLFGYHAALHSFPQVVERLRHQIVALPAGVPYVAIGHSLGGLLLRAALDSLPPEHQPRHLFMLATPSNPVHIASRLRKFLPYRLWNGDAGQMLADAERMGAIPLPPPEVPSTIIAGTKGWPRGRRFSVFGEHPNDLIVSIPETLPPADACPHVEHICIPAAHTLIMNHPEVFRIIRERALDKWRSSSPGMPSSNRSDT